MKLSIRVYPRLRAMRSTAIAVALLAAQLASGCDTHSPGGNSATSSPHSSTAALKLDDLMGAPVPSLCKHNSGNLVNGTLPLQDPSTGFVVIANKSNNDQTPLVAFGDVNGDGVDDGALVTACTAGGVAWPATIQVYTAGPTRLGGVDLGEVTNGGREYVTDLSISGGLVHVSWVTTGPNEPECCGTVKVTGDIRVNGSTVAIENVRKLN